MEPDALPAPVSPSKLAEFEALLFVHGEPLSGKKAMELLGVPAEEFARLKDELKSLFHDSNRGLMLMEIGEKIQLVTKPEFKDMVAQFVKSELSEDLTPASLETLAIIAYFGPISRSRIDYERGVNSSFILRNLLLRGLIDRIPDPSQAGASLYDVSFDFMRHLGLPHKEALPDYEKFKVMLKSFEAGVMPHGEQQTSPAPVPEVSPEMTPQPTEEHHE